VAASHWHGGAIKVPRIGTSRPCIGTAAPRNRASHVLTRSEPAGDLTVAISRPLVTCVSRLLVTCMVAGHVFAACLGTCACRARIASMQPMGDAGRRGPGLQAVALEPNHGAALSELAGLLQRRGDYHAAAGMYQVSDTRL
jgi:hypothetical protein